MCRPQGQQCAHRRRYPHRLGVRVRHAGLRGQHHQLQGPCPLRAQWRLMSLQFTGNHADLGGAIALLGATNTTAYVVDSTFSLNRGDESGGAVYESLGSSVFATPVYAHPTPTPCETLLCCTSLMLLTDTTTASSRTTWRQGEAARCTCTARVPLSPIARSPVTRYAHCDTLVAFARLTARRPMTAAAFLPSAALGAMLPAPAWTRMTVASPCWTPLWKPISTSDLSAESRLRRQCDR